MAATEDEKQCVSPESDGIADAGEDETTQPPRVSPGREEEEEDRRGGGSSDARYPLKVTYCGVCSLPTEFCQFTPEAAKCRQWLEKNVPDAFARMSLVGAGGGSEEDEEEEAEERKRQKRGGRGQIRPKKTMSSMAAAAPRRVTIAKVPRAKKKFVTRVCGLAALGVDPKEAKRFFAQRFSCGASLNADADEIVVQGDVTDDLAAAIAERWAEVDPECIHDLGEVKK